VKRTAMTREAAAVAGCTVAAGGGDAVPVSEVQGDTESEGKPRGGTDAAAVVSER